jgi:hypothetical protein
MVSIINACNTNVMVLGSVQVEFGLIYGMIKDLVRQSASLAFFHFLPLDLVALGFPFKWSSPDSLFL